MRFTTTLASLLLAATALTGPSSLAAPAPSQEAAPAAAGAAGEEGWHPETGGIFNIPRSTLGESTRIERSILAAINHARPGSRIRVSLFSFDRTNMAHALVEAKRRGVSVQVLLNDHQVTPAQRVLHRGLGRNRWRENFSYECSRGCRSRAENLHTKLFLFSHTGRATNVVMAGSVNLTRNGAFNQYNDLLVTAGRDAYYEAMNDLWTELRRDKPERRPYRVLTPGSFDIRVLPRYQMTAATDPVMEILNGVRCTGADGAGVGGRTVVRASLHSWADGRGVYLARKLRRLYGAGCDVRAMYGMAGRLVRRELVRPTARGRLPVRTNGYDTNSDGEIDLYSHHKYLLISGHYAGESDAHRVYTGSSNWNAAGASGDEVIIGVEGRAHFVDWAANFNNVWVNHSHAIRYTHARSGTTQVGAVPRASGPAWEND